MGLQLKKYSEEEVICFIKQNSRAGFDYIFTNYSPVLFRTINKIIINEYISKNVLQETFVSIWKNIEQYDASISNFYMWMHAIARSKAIEFMPDSIRNVKNKAENQELDSKVPFYPSRLKKDDIGPSMIAIP